MKKFFRYFLVIYLLLLSISIQLIYVGSGAPNIIQLISIILPIASVLIVITIFLDNLGDKDK